MGKKILLYILLFVIIIGCFVLYAVLSKGQKYEKIVYHIEYPSDTLFTETELAQYVKKNCASILGKSFDSVKLGDFEKTVEQYPYLEDADVINNKGTLIVKARQEKIIAKITNKDNEQFLLAESGKLVPSSNNTAGRIVVANGSILYRYVENYKVRETKDTSKTKSTLPKYHTTLYSIWRIAHFTENNPFWKAQIGQIHIDEKQEIELIPTVGDHVIIFGRIKEQEDIDKVIAERFNNLKNIYTQGFRITGWQKYKTINLKFGTEIPCERRVN